MHEKLKAQMKKYPSFEAWAKSCLRGGDPEKYRKIYNGEDEIRPKRKRRTRAEIEADNAAD